MSAVGDYEAIGKRRQELFGDSWLPVEKDRKLQPVWSCELCHRIYNPNTGENKGACDGQCGVY
ncbi:MAG: hypothetical protein Q8P36_02395 [bacterium]|nr:hypothetical protein [bacterium]